MSTWMEYSVWSGTQVQGKQFDWYTADAPAFLPVLRTLALLSTGTAALSFALLPSSRRTGPRRCAWVHRPALLARIALKTALASPQRFVSAAVPELDGVAGDPTAQAGARCSVDLYQNCHPRFSAACALVTFSQDVLPLKTPVGAVACADAPLPALLTNARSPPLPAGPGAAGGPRWRVACRWDGGAPRVLRCSGPARPDAPTSRLFAPEAAAQTPPPPPPPPRHQPPAVRAKARAMPPAGNPES